MRCGNGSQKGTVPFGSTGKNPKGCNEFGRCRPDHARPEIKVRADSKDVGKAVKIFASSGLDEYKIQELVRSGAPIDAFGVGTKLAVIADAPELDMAYKLVEYAVKARLKLSTKKLLYTGRKQVFRQIENGRMTSDVIGRFGESLPGERLLKPLMVRGQPTAKIQLAESRQHLRGELQLLPDHLRGLQPVPPPYPVGFSEQLQTDLDVIRREIVFAVAKASGRDSV